jgi:hypothetical protein
MLMTSQLLEIVSQLVLGLCWLQSHDLCEVKVGRLPEI